MTLRSRDLRSRFRLQKTLRTILGWTALGILFVMHPVEARELTGRLGLGYNAQLANTSASGGVPGVAVKYAFSRDIAIEAIAAASTGSPTNSAFGAKFFKNLFLETNLNFYFMLGGALVTGGGSSGSQFLSGFGTEFFLPGLESLGWSMEVGGSFDNLSGSFALKTLGVSFLNAGMRFYF
jgi:hypothetical protein